MKKQIRTTIIATITTIIIIFSCALALPASAEVGDRGEFYPRLTVVVDVVELGGLRYIACQDKDGNIWGFYDDEAEWDVGDIANLLMWNMGEHEEDDEIIEVYWEGYTEDIETFFSLEGWR
jgi:hypothetical protein